MTAHEEADTAEQCVCQCGKQHCWSIHEREFEESIKLAVKEMVAWERRIEEYRRNQEGDQ